MNDSDKSETNTWGRPKLEIKLTGIDWTFEVISATGLIITFLIVILNYNGLPAEIPKHYNASGKPDGFSEKGFIWFLPSIMVIIYSLITIVSRFPHVFNYPTKITVENARRQYLNALLMMRTLKTVIGVLFFYLTYATVQNGLGKMNGLGILFLPIFLAAIAATVGYFIYRGYKLK